MSKMKYRLLNSVAALGIAFTLSHSAFAGNGTSGGGYRCELAQKKSVLLDLVDTFPSDFNTSISKKAAPVVLGKVGNMLAYEKKSAVDLTEAYALAKARLDLWFTAGNSKTLIRFLRQALSGMEFRFSKFAVPRSGEAYSASAETLSLCEKIIPVVVYTPELGAIVSTEDWNLLDVFSQAGLLIHEAMRHLQLAYQVIQVKNENVVKLQKVVANLMIKNPKPQFSLETSEYVDGYILEAANNRTTDPLKESYAYLDPAKGLSMSSFNENYLIAYIQDNRFDANGKTDTKYAIKNNIIKYTKEKHSYGWDSSGRYGKRSRREMSEDIDDQIKNEPAAEADAEKAIKEIYSKFENLSQDQE